MEVERIKKKRNRAPQNQPLGQRLVHFAIAARKNAKQLAPGREKEMLLRKARQAEAAAELEEALSSPQVLRHGGTLLGSRRL
jgi:hypothetical protein